MQVVLVTTLLGLTIGTICATLGEDVAEKHISYYITTILNHYKQDDPVGAPIVPVPDPLEIPPLTHSMGLATMKCKHVLLYGLSKFRIDRVHIDLVEMQVKASIKLETVNITGNYTLKSWFSTSNGNFSVNLLNVTIEATSGLEVQEDDQLETQEIYTEFYNENVTMEFVGLGVLEKSMVGSSGSFVFESTKPYMMRQMNEKLREDINARVKAIPQKFPKPVAPIDQVIGRAREYARVHYDPFKLDDFEYATTISKIKLAHTWVSGFSSFHRVGDVTLTVENKTVALKFNVGVENVSGSTQWVLNVMQGSIAGNVGFKLDSLEVEIAVSQAMDTRKPPYLDNIQITLGDVHVDFNGAGIFDRPLVVVSNLLPHLLNQQIVGCLELFIKEGLRMVFNDVCLDEVVLGSLGKIDNLYNSGTLTNLLTQ